MKVLVTGGTGFIGSHLTEALLKRGFQVRCLVRDPGRLRWLGGLPVETVRGDCSDPESLDAATAGVDYIFHAAGLTKAADPKDYYRVNAEGTRNLCQAVTRSGVLKKLVYISSQAAAGPSEKGRPRVEPDAEAPVSDYGRSKLLGEKYALEYRGSLNIAILRPTSVYGPRDKDIYAFFKMVSRGFRTSFRQERLVSVCYVHDLVEAAIAAAGADTESGETFFIGEPEPYSWDALGEAMEGALGVKARRVVVPIPLLYAVALMAEGFAALARKPALLNRQKMAEIRQRYWVVDVSRARDRLGFRAVTDFKAGARATAEWYRQNAWL